MGNEAVVSLKNAILMAQYYYNYAYCGIQFYKNRKVLKKRHIARENILRYIKAVREAKGVFYDLGKDCYTRIDEITSSMADIEAFNIQTANFRDRCKAFGIWNIVLNFYNER